MLLFSNESDIHSGSYVSTTISNIREKPAVYSLHDNGVFNSVSGIVAAVGLPVVRTASGFRYELGNAE